MFRAIYNEGDRTFRIVPLDERARPVVVSATYGIFDRRKGDGDSEYEVVAAGTAAVVGAISTTTDADCGPGESDPALVPLTSTTDVVIGRHYLISGGGNSEAVLVRSISSGVSVTGAYELQHDYTSGATFVELEIGATFPTAESADETEIWAGAGPYDVVFKYTVNAYEYIVPCVGWISRYSAAIFVTETDVLRHYPTLARRVRESVTIQQGVLAATTEYFADLMTAGKDPAYFRPNDIALLAVSYKAAEQILRWIGTGDHDTAEADRLEERYRQLLNQQIVGQPKVAQVTVNPHTDTAAPGGDKMHGNAYVRRG